jgi:two-component system response regulator YesN
VPRALIVEDERMTRETLRNLVPWSRLGVDEVETARDGVDALEKVERRMPDLVVCDIRMPRMGGLEFARIVRERNPRCGIIFLSGYSEKAYLKEAIRLQAADYLDKPVNLQEVSAAVERNVRAILDRASESAEAEHARKVLTDLEPLLREAFAADLVRPEADPDAVRGRHDPKVAGPFLAGPVRAAVAEVEAVGGREPIAEARFRQAVRSVNEAPQAAGAVAAWQAGPGRIGLLAAGSELVASEQALERALDGMGPALVRVLGEVHLRFGLGPALPAAQASSSWAMALAALAGAFYAPRQRFLRAGTAGAQAGAFRVDPAFLGELARLLSAGDLEGAGAALRGLELRAREAADPDTGGVREAYRRALCVLLEGAPGWEPAEVRVEQERMQDAVRAQRSLDGLGGLAEDTLHRCFAPGAGGAAADRRMARIKEYIRAHHADPDLLIETIAADVGLSESYLCTVFKQACGVTVKDHLTQVRIERAKELLRGGREKLQAVALEVGFRDANYFSTVFKREVGITPREYRERSQR